MIFAVVNFDSKPISSACAVICQGLIQCNHQVWLHREVSVSSNGAYPATVTPTKYYNELVDLKDVDFIILDITYNTFSDFSFLYSFKKKLAIIDMHDSANFRKTPPEFVNFSSHLNSNLKKNSEENKMPLPFGISQELINATEIIINGMPDGKRAKIAYNFTPSYQQSVRASLSFSFLPSAKASIFKIDESRNSHEKYIANMAESVAVISYGGDFIQDVKKNLWILNNTNRSVDNYIFDVFNGDAAIVRWDSWRFYEACACGTLPIQLDFNKYGFELPSIPIPWIHYLPLDLECPAKLLKCMTSMFSNDTLIFEALGLKCREWAIKEFGPIGMANYFLSKIK